MDKAETFLLGILIGFLVLIAIALIYPDIGRFDFYKKGKTLCELIGGRPKYELIEQEKDKLTYQITCE